MPIINSQIKGKQPQIESLNVTPSTSAQQITAPTGTDGYSPVNVSAVTSSIDANIVAGNIKDGVTILGVTGDYTGGGGGKYQLFDRVKDDSNIVFGTVVGFHTDANNQRYAVILPDSDYRANGYAEGVYCSNDSAIITNLPVYNDITVYTASETATFNCDKILDYCTANNYTSTLVSRARMRYFVIEGITYYCQVPTVAEIVYMLLNRITINNLDTSSNRSFCITEGNYYFASNQQAAAYSWGINNTGRCTTIVKTSQRFTLPVLEIPIN